jgi:hypothetical protein
MLPLLSHDEDEIDEFDDDIDTFCRDSPIGEERGTTMRRTGEERGTSNTNLVVLPDGRKRERRGTGLGLGSLPVSPASRGGDKRNGILERQSSNVDFPKKSGMLESTPERRSSNFDVPKKSGMLESTDERRHSNFDLPKNSGSTPERRSSYFDFPKKSGMLESTDERRPSNFYPPSSIGERRSSEALGNERRTSAIRRPLLESSPEQRASNVDVPASAPALANERRSSATRRPSYIPRGKRGTIFGKVNIFHSK